MQAALPGKAYGVTIENCYYSGEVSAKDYAGGIAQDMSPGLKQSETAFLWQKA